MNERWTEEAVERRYTRHAKARGMEHRRDLSPVEPEKEGTHWVFTPMNRVIEGIEAGDPACREIGVEYLEEEDDSLPFASILRSNAARALRRGDLPDPLKARLKRRIAALLAAGEVRPEFKQYAKLLNAIGISRAELASLEPHLDQSNEFVMRYFHYLRNGAK